MNDRSETVESMLVETSIPLSLEEMRNLFINRGKFRYILKYSESTLKSTAFLFYVSNLELPAELDVTDDISTEEKLELVHEYMNIANMVDIGTLAHTVAEIIFVSRGIDTTGMFVNTFLTPEEIQLFIKRYRSDITRWIILLNSLYVYALYVCYELPHDKTINPIQQAAPHINDATFIGNNFIHVMNLPSFYEIYFATPIDLKNTRFFTHQFTEYCYRGKNLYYYFANEDNWLLLHVLAALYQEEVFQDGTDNSPD